MGPTHQMFAQSQSRWSLPKVRMGSSPKELSAKESYTQMDVWCHCRCMNTLALIWQMHALASHTKHAQTRQACSCKANQVRMGKRRLQKHARIQVSDNGREHEQHKAMLLMLECTLEPMVTFIATMANGHSESLPGECSKASCM